MGLRFRKTFGKGPFKMTVSKSGVGYSVGGKGFRVTKKAGGGTRTTASIPGTGISYTSDSKKKKSTGAVKKSSSTTRNTSSSSVSKSNGGCLTSFLWLIGICLAIGLLAKYWKLLLIAAIGATAIYIGYRLHSKKADVETEEVTLPEPAVTGIAPVQEEVALPKPAESKHTEQTDEFDVELAAIPMLDIVLSDPASKHFLKDMPEYSFSNITRKTRLDSIFPIVFLDVETTGFAPSKCEILEVSAIKFTNGMIPEAAFSTLCKPKKPIPEEASAVNHITDDMVSDAPSFAQIAPALTEFIKGCHIAGHNLDFDLRFIFAGGADLPENVRFYDTLDLAHLTIPNSSVFDYKLDTICHYYGIWRNGAHRSLSDAYATAKIFTKLVQDKTSRQLDVNSEILSEMNAE